MKICQICGARFRGDPTTCPLDGGNLVPLPDPLVGRTIAGRYVIEERIGAGGMGTVYRAKHEVVGRDVAVKFLSPELAYEPSNKTRFLREARAANRINHEHIIDITDFGETDDGLVFLVMEFLDGVPLNEEIARGPLPLPRALIVTMQLSQALARAHELDVVHRDIKPDNIFLLRGYDGDFVKILDFGLAHMKGELRVTATGTVFGTPEYMSPEQARGAPMQMSADLYSLGCVVFEMLTGVLPFQGSTPDLILKHLREPARAPSFHDPRIPTEIDRMVLKLLEKRAEDRYASAHVLAEEVKQHLEQLRESQRPSVGDTTIVEPRKRRDSITHKRDKSPSATGLVQRWRERVEVFRALVPRAHPIDPAPEWLLPAIEGLADQVELLGALHEDLAVKISASSSQEGQARDVRMRIGRALDALSSEETRVRSQLADAESRTTEARARIAQVTPALQAQWAQLPIHAPDAGLTDEVVKALAAVGALAQIRLESRQLVHTLEKDRRRLLAECDDLEFQVGQLKGRLGGVSAATEVDLDDLRRQTLELDRRLQERLDAVAREAEPVVRHFMSFSHLRDVVRSTHGPLAAVGD